MSLLDALDPDQQEVARATRGRVVVIAAAGSGKTRAITHRIAHAVATGHQNEATGLALSFTTRAAAQLRSQLSTLGVSGVTAATFHSTALRQLMHFWPRAIGGPAWKVMASKSAVMDEAIKQAGLDFSTSMRRQLSGEIDWAKSSGLDVASYVSLGRETMDLDAVTVGEVWGRYSDLCHTKRVVDFEDVLQLTLGMLQQRPDVLAEVRQRYNWFTVDEYQDVTPLQHAVLSMWLGESSEVCVVGDPAQTIYSFAGAAPDFLQQFATEHPESTFVELSRTYRCPPEIVAAANSLMGAETPELRSALVMQSQSGTTGSVDLHAFDDEIAEANAVAAEISGLLAGGEDSRAIAVLVRVNSMTAAIEAAFDAQGIAYTLKGGQKFFERREIKQALLKLKADSYVITGAEMLQAVEAAARAEGWSETQPTTSVEARSIWEALSALVTLARDLASANPQASLESFFELIAQRTMSQHEPTASAVTISTIHAAKGLEWNHVFLPSLNEGMLPYMQMTSPEQLAEERRLLYVAITRAKRNVHLSWTRRRGGNLSGGPSRFLAQLDVETGPASTSTVRRAPAVEPPTVSVAHCRICGRGLATGTERAVLRCNRCPSDANPAIAASLTEWRELTATELSTIPALVMTSATIAALSEIRPTNADELANIQGLSASKIAQYGDVILDIVGNAV